MTPEISGYTQKRVQNHSTTLRISYKHDIVVFVALQII